MSLFDPEIPKISDVVPAKPRKLYPKTRKPYRTAQLKPVRHYQGPPPRLDGRKPPPARVSEAEIEQIRLRLVNAGKDFHFLADQMGYSPTYLRRLLRGERPLRVHHLLAIQMVLLQLEQSVKEAIWPEIPEFDRPTVPIPAEVDAGKAKQKDGVWVHEGPAPTSKWDS